MTSLTLYGYWRSSASWRVRIALNMKGVAYRYVPVHLVNDGGEQHKPDFQKRNPMEQVPVLEVAEAGRTWRMSQSLAIVQWLERTLPSPALVPADARLAGHVWQLAETMNSGIQPLHNLSTLNAVKELGGDDQAWARKYIARGLLALESEVQPFAGRYACGDAVSVADVCLVPQLYAARRFKVDLAPYPTLVRIESACQDLPAFQKAHAEAQPDAVPPPR